MVCLDKHKHNYGQHGNLQFRCVMLNNVELSLNKRNIVKILVIGSNCEKPTSLNVGSMSYVVGHACLFHYASRCGI